MLGFGCDLSCRCDDEQKVKDSAWDGEEITASGLACEASSADGAIAKTAS